MKVPIRLLFISLPVLFMSAQSTSPQEEILELKKLGKNHIIHMALKELHSISKPEVTEDDFHFIQILASNKRIKVHFGYNVIYFPKNSSYNTDIIVEFPSKSISISSDNNKGGNTTFYRPTTEDMNVINFILNRNGANNNVFNKGNKSSVVISIYEKENHYLVYTTSRNPDQGGIEYIEEIHKETGEILSTLSGHYDPAPETPSLEKEKFIEIDNK
ncbi:hypothetical protein [Aquimarina spinulae]|uniref:hypothetical protein n=2 Tax=Aquimarina spinulae TaxID=1192023 RepID=UPI00140478D0|nr:hypothetical protein [Aquimarina spinulae]